MKKTGGEKLDEKVFCAEGDSYFIAQIPSKIAISPLFLLDR
jgi:hypothetical protein